MAYSKYDRKAYKFFVLDLVSNRIVSGWEYNEDARDFVKEQETQTENFKVYTRAYLVRLGLDPAKNASWGSMKLGNVKYATTPEVILAGDFRKEIQIPEIKVRFNKGKTFGKVGSSDDVHKFLLRVYGRSIGIQEHFVLLLFDNSLNILGYYKHTVGTPVSTLADIPMLMSVVLKSMARSFIVSHNHPSGNNSPSNADVQLTRQVKEAADSLRIKLLDHIIVTQKNGYYSFADNGSLSGIPALGKSAAPNRDIVQDLRQEILNQLKKVQANPSLTPQLHSIIQTDKGYRWAENRIVDMMIADGITVSSAIPQIEAEL